VTTRTTRPPWTLLGYADGLHRAGLLTLSWLTLAACVMVEVWRRRPCKTCGARPAPVMLRGDGCVLCRGHR